MGQGEVIGKRKGTAVTGLLNGIVSKDLEGGDS